MHGREARMPTDTSLLPPEHEFYTAHDWVKETADNLSQARKWAKENLEQTQERTKLQHDRRFKVTEPVYAEGDFVWLHNSKSIKGLTKKLLHPNHGPYIINHEYN
ncbi:uncharacterized protein LOC141908824 [Tubulanus polymorphus]|uniref:uncharacterized protein LOC141908824 n=1 Tax=Tubulanus polymorphus TaxID=672921 RepID=UPI003DA46E48